MSRFLRAGLLAIVLATASGIAQADPLSISPSGNVAAQSTLTVTWTPGSQPLAVLIVKQNGTALNNTLVSTANSGSAQVPLPAGLSCGPSYSYQVFKEEITPSAQVLLTWGNLQAASSPNFTIKCPLVPHPYNEGTRLDAHKVLPNVVPSNPMSKIDPNKVMQADPHKVTPAISVKVSCPPGEQVVDGKCGVPRRR